ncbi:MAG: amidophosphoribosyltransferase [Candidatus Thermoplasmatota archaeon]|nr:amidophosphoribosyltransferase [Candidatus Thermoplasmatota archaeon]
MTGLFGVVGRSNVVSTLFYGTDYHSHLGTKYGGIAYVDDKGDTIKKIHDINNTQFKSKFTDEIKGSSSNIMIGVISDKDPQPLTFLSKFGPFAVCMNGLIVNKEELKDSMISDGTSFAEVYHGDINQSDLLANLINKKDSIEDGIQYMWDSIDGAASLLIMTPNGIYAARDRKGISPLVLGTDGSRWVVASESSSFPNLGFKVERFLASGEIVFISMTGPETVMQGSPCGKTCAFLWVYTGFPSSSYEGINTEVVRENCGRFLARRDDVKADLVAGVPDSGTAHAIGYAMESGIPFRRVLHKYTPGYGRSYTPLTQEDRDRIALMKLIPNKETIEGNRIILCEDSIVRGTQLKNFTVKKLRQAGAREVHARPACPPLLYPCRYMLSTRRIEELAARKAIIDIEGRDLDDQEMAEYLDPDSEKYRMMVDHIRRDLDLDTLRFQRLEDMIEAIGLPRERLCLYCWTGERV